MDTITLVNGNKQPYTKDLPRLVILTDHLNPEALAHIKENTGLDFVGGGWNNYEAQPTEAWQIVALFMTYNFKTRMYDNWNVKNSIYLKFDHHVGFDVDSICLNCCKHNNIHTGSMLPGDYMAC